MKPALSLHKGTIMVVDDEKDIVSIMIKYLSDEGYLVYAVSEGDSAAGEAAKIVPDLIILDVKMPVKDGYQVKTELNQNPLTANIPVIFLSSSVSTLDKITGLRLRADDYVTKPFDVLELIARIDTALSRRKHYEKISMKDELTGLPNSYHFKKELGIAFNMAQRYGRIFTVGFIDINRFKEINDNFGHLTGDCVLREVAKRMEMTLRNPDVLARYGGDEFCIIMREASPEQAQVVLNRLKTRVEGNPFAGLDGDREFLVSISVGMVTYNDKFSSAEELIGLADRNMYRDKKKI
ncbi:MAG: diguanylate cyclase [Candidatus Omnitrophica bacterium]|nr:diguanylate cyclase [Candidatus Omnitrophota bacterium]